MVATEVRVLHAPGHCPDRSYGANCDGIGHYQIDPYAAEIHADYNRVWLCDGVALGLAEDI